MLMAETDRLTESTDWIDLEFVQRERTPREIIEKGIRHHLAGLSLSNTVILLEELGVERSRTAIHNWVQKAEIQPKGGETGSRCGRSEGDPDQRRAVLAVRCGRSANEQNPPFAAISDVYDRDCTGVPHRAGRETRRLE